MAKRSRTELKNIFSKGKIPEEQHFHDLIESMVNLNDERLAGNPGGGLIIFEGPENALIEFYESPEAGGPEWFIRRKNGRGDAGFDIGKSVMSPSERRLTPESRLFISASGGVGIDTDQPRHSLDIHGDVAMQNRIGTYAAGTFAADGKWRNVLPKDKHSGPSNYYALEILAHTIASNTRSLHSVCHAICVSAYPSESSGLKKLLGINNRQGIRTTSHYYSRRGHRLQFRWAGTRIEPRLEVRSRRNMSHVEIQFQVTSLFPSQQKP